MFRTEVQQAQVCNALCAVVGFRGLWTKDGPTPRAIELLKKGGTMSHSERLMFRAAWDIWNGRGQMRLKEALHTLDRTNLTALGSLLVAIAHGPEAIDLWLEQYGKGKGSNP